MINEIEIPEGWEIVKVKDVGRVETGSTPSKSNPDYYSNNFPFYKPTDLEAGYSVNHATDNLSEEGIKQARFLPKNSILVTCIGATIGKTGIIRKEGASNQQINAIIPNKNHDPNFIYYQVIAPIFQKEIKDNAAATTLPILNKSKFQNLELVICSIEEQQKLVAKIEELFSELDKGKQQLETALQQLKIYRQSVLKWAFEGKLTNKEVKEGELPEGWKWVKVSEISNVVRGGSPRPAGDPRFYDGNIPFLKVKDITKDTNKYLTTFKYTIKEAGLHKTRKITPNTLLLSNSGATLGVPKICMIDATMNDGIAAFLELDLRSNLYLYYFWLSKTRELRNINMGAAQPNLNTDIIKNYDVPYCSFEEQQLVVQEIENRLSVCDKVEETISQSLQQAEILRQSILKKAFEGKLIN